jgi:predicted amidohydrolase
VDSAHGFLITEREFSDDESKVSIGLANIRAEVPGIEANKDKILKAATIFKEREVNIAIFPEFSLSGYFWDEHDDCARYMREACIENHVDWVENELKPLLDDRFRAVTLNNLRRGEGDLFLNTTYVVGADHDYLAEEHTYDKVFLPGVEKDYTASGRDDRLTVESQFGRFGFTTCYDYLFSELLREYAVVDDVDAIVQIASWRAAANRDYPGMNIRTDHYYGDLWDFVMPASSATNQFWTIACNAVGRHGVSNVPFWGGSGVWAPSGMCLVQASRFNEELVIVHNIDIAGARAAELDDFNYAFDFKEIYRPLHGSRTFTRHV